MILVCSATGKVSSELIKFLRAANAPFKAATRDVDRAQKTLGENIALVKLDYDDATTFEAALKDADKLFILHPQDKPGRIVELKAFVDAAATAGVKQAVVMSALGANLRENDGMYQLEKHVKASGITHTALRPNWFMQNFSTTDLRDIKERGEVKMAADDQKVRFIDTRDIAEVAAKILLDGGHVGKAYTLSGPEALSYTEAAELISTVVGYPITHKKLNADDELKQMENRHVPQEFIDFMAWLYDDIQSGYAAQPSIDVGLVLDRPPRMFQNFVRDYADVWKRE